MAPLVAQRDRRRSGRGPDHVRGRRRAPAHRVRGRWLPGYEESRPVRIGNAASEQFQLDVYGEVVRRIYEARRLGVPEESRDVRPGAALLEFVESAWQRPDDGIWEVRGGRRHFVHSKMMAWVAIDRFVRGSSRSSTPPRRSHARALAALPRSFAIASTVTSASTGSIGGRTRSRRPTTARARRGRATNARARFLTGERSAYSGTIRAIEKNLCTTGSYCATGRTTQRRSAGHRRRVPGV